MIKNTPSHRNDSDSIDTPISLSPAQIKGVKKWADYVASEIDEFIEYDSHLEDEEQQESGYLQTKEMHKLLIELIIADYRLN